MLTQRQRQEMIDKLQKLPSIVEAAVKDLDDRQLDTQYREGSWTVRQVVHHLVDSHMNGYIRTKLMLTEDKPTLKTYEQERWAELSDAATMPVESSLAILGGLHARWASLLAGLEESQWSSAAIHPVNGEMTIDDLLALYSGHGEKHVEKVLALRADKKW